MLNSHHAKIMISSLIVFIAAIGLLGDSGSIYAADRTVIGELWPMDNGGACPSAVAGFNSLYANLDRSEFLALTFYFTPPYVCCRTAIGALRNTDSRALRRSCLTAPWISSAVAPAARCTARMPRRLITC